MLQTKCGPYLYKRGGVYYFSRRIPSDLKGHYKLNRIVVSLKTTSLRAAQTRASSLATKLDEDWLMLRWRSSSDPFARYLVGDQRTEHLGGSLSSASSKAPLLSEAKKLYLDVKGKGRPKIFRLVSCSKPVQALGLCQSAHQRHLQYTCHTKGKMLNVECPADPAFVWMVDVIVPLDG